VIKEEAMKVINPRLVTIVAALALTIGAAGWSFAQAFGQQPVQPVVITGSDIGFRMEGRRGKTPVGKFVVRVGGEWVAVEFSSGAIPAASN
jgi:hypothetical protein